MIITKLFKLLITVKSTRKTFIKRIHFGLNKTIRILRYSVFLLSTWKLNKLCGKFNFQSKSSIAFFYVYKCIYYFYGLRCNRTYLQVINFSSIIKHKIKKLCIVLFL